MMQPHYFLGLEVDKELATAVSYWLGGTMGNHFKQYVHPLDYHITVAFLGDRNPKQIDGQLADIIGEIPSIKMELTEVDLFGLEKKPRIFWIGLKYNQSLFFLKKEVDKIIAEHGYKIDTRPYTPHITLSKRWISENEFQREKINHLFPFKGHTFSVNELHLYETNIHRSPKYKKIQSWEFTEK
ncbi:RNA 2',3'-cyclic phosphodiesterase [Bacillus carboniphilus]|uniref:RNA 2',3'-cyclic phosphodiesterase n=1 Tax=Bacillus carboniphilus TaxID=86663 RepID=A0ABY9JP07_9BACI|nr:RNA 2',3'-cyclic phosphodiesterase [Bacillus carboniphilus]WLR41152.1 RNA 2',3'-cyclic phosphodiesterase [Bacillus carboniphilus]